jgi:hypothetical protein
MSVDWLFLIPVPPSHLASDAYLDVGEEWKGDDYVIELGERWDPRVERSAERRHAMALELTRRHLAALRGVGRPREVVVITDAGAPDERAPTYAAARSQWLGAGGFLLPDVLDEVLPDEEAARAALQPADIRVALPDRTRRARLRRLDPVFALEQLHGSRKGAVNEVRGVRAGVILIEVEGEDLEKLARHYRSALRALGMKPREDKPSKWIEESFVQMRGRADGVDVSVTARPDGRGGIGVSVLWIDRVAATVPPAPTGVAETRRAREKGKPSRPRPRRTRS